MHKSRACVTHPTAPLKQQQRACARKHLVDANDVVRVCAHAHVEAVLATELYKSLVGGNTCSFKCLAGQLLTLVGHKVHNGRKLVHRCLLVADIVDSQLRI